MSSRRPSDVQPVSKEPELGGLLNFSREQLAPKPALPKLALPTPASIDAKLQKSKGDASNAPYSGLQADFLLAAGVTAAGVVEQALDTVAPMSFPSYEDFQRDYPGATQLTYASILQLFAAAKQARQTFILAQAANYPLATPHQTQRALAMIQYYWVKEERINQGVAWFAEYELLKSNLATKAIEPAVKKEADEYYKTPEGKALYDRINGRNKKKLEEALKEIGKWAEFTAKVQADILNAWPETRASVGFVNVLQKQLKKDLEKEKKALKDSVKDVTEANNTFQKTSKRPPEGSPELVEYEYKLHLLEEQVRAANSALADLSPRADAEIAKYVGLAEAGAEEAMRDVIRSKFQAAFPNAISSDFDEFEAESREQIRNAIQYDQEPWKLTAKEKELGGDKPKAKPKSKPDPGEEEGDDDDDKIAADKWMFVGGGFRWLAENAQRAKLPREDAFGEGWDKDKFEEDNKAAIEKEEKRLIDAQITKIKNTYNEATIVNLVGSVLEGVFAKYRPDGGAKNIHAAKELLETKDGLVKDSPEYLAAFKELEKKAMDRLIKQEARMIESIGEFPRYEADDGAPLKVWQYYKFQTIELPPNLRADDGNATRYIFLAKDKQSVGKRGYAMVRQAEIEGNQSEAKQAEREANAAAEAAEKAAEKARKEAERIEWYNNLNDEERKAEDERQELLKYQREDRELKRAAKAAKEALDLLEEGDPGYDDAKKASDDADGKLQSKRAANKKKNRAARRALKRAKDEKRRLEKKQAFEDGLVALDEDTMMRPARLAAAARGLDKESADLQAKFDALTAADPTKRFPLKDGESVWREDEVPGKGGSLQPSGNIRPAAPKNAQEMSMALAAARGAGRTYEWSTAEKERAAAQGIPEGFLVDSETWSICEVPLTKEQHWALFLTEDQFQLDEDSQLLEDDDDEDDSVGSVTPSDSGEGEEGQESVSTDAPLMEALFHDGSFPVVATTGSVYEEAQKVVKGFSKGLWRLAEANRELSEEDLYSAKPVVFNKPYARELLRQHLRELRRMHVQALAINGSARFVNVWSSLGPWEDEAKPEERAKLDAIVEQLLPVWWDMLKYRNSILKAKEMQLQQDIKLVIGLTDDDSRAKISSYVRNVESIMRHDVGQKGRKTIWSVEARRLLQSEGGQLPGQLYTPQPYYLPLRVAAPPRVGKSAAALLMASLAKRAGMVSLYSVSPNKTVPIAELQKKLLRIGWRPIDPHISRQQGGAIAADRWLEDDKKNGSATYTPTLRGTETPKELTATRMRFGAFAIDDLPRFGPGATECNPTRTVDEPPAGIVDKTAAALAKKNKRPIQYPLIDMVMYSSDTVADCMRAGALLAEWRRKDVVVFHLRDEAQSLAKEEKNKQSACHTLDVPPPAELQYLRYYFSNLYSLSCNVTATHFATLLEETMWGYIGSAQQNVRASLPVVATPQQIMEKTGATFLPKLSKALLPDVPAGYVGVEKLTTWERVKGMPGVLSIGANKTGAGKTQAELDPNVEKLSDAQKAARAKEDEDAANKSTSDVIAGGTVDSDEEWTPPPPGVEEDSEDEADRKEFENAKGMKDKTKRKKAQALALARKDRRFIDAHFQEWLDAQVRPISYYRTPDDVPEYPEVAGKELLMAPMYIGALNNNIRDSGMVSFIKRFGFWAHRRFKVAVEKKEFPARPSDPSAKNPSTAQKEKAQKAQEAWDWEAQRQFGVAFVLFTTTIKSTDAVDGALGAKLGTRTLFGDVETVGGESGGGDYKPNEMSFASDDIKTSALVCVYDPALQPNRDDGQDTKIDDPDNEDGVHPRMTAFFTVSAETAIKHLLQGEKHTQIQRYAILGYGMLKAGLTVQTYLDADNEKGGHITTPTIFCPQYVALSTAQDAALDAQLQIAGRAFVDIKGRSAPGNWRIQFLGTKDRVQQLQQYSGMEHVLARIERTEMFRALKEGFGAEFLTTNEFGDLGSVGARRGKFTSILGLTPGAAKKLAEQAEKARKEIEEELQGQKISEEELLRRQKEKMQNAYENLDVQDAPKKDLEAAAGVGE